MTAYVTADDCVPKYLYLCVRDQLLTYCR